MTYVAAHPGKPDLSDPLGLLSFTIHLRRLKRDAVFVERQRVHCPPYPFITVPCSKTTSLLILSPFLYIPSIAATVSITPRKVISRSPSSSSTMLANFLASVAPRLNPKTTIRSSGVRTDSFRFPFASFRIRLESPYFGASALFTSPGALAISHPMSGMSSPFALVPIPM